MPDIAPQEAMPNILVKEAAPAIPTTTRDKVVADARKKLEESTWEESAKVIIKPVEGGKIAQKIEQIGIERDNSGAKVRTPEEQTRYEAAQKESALAQKYVEVGYDQLSRDDQTNLRTKILEEAQRQPLISDAVRGLTPTQKQAYVERLLRDPRLRNEAQGRIEELVNSPDLVNAVSEAKADLEEAQNQLTDATADQQETERRFSMLDALSKQYERDATTGKGIAGSKAETLDNLRNDSPTIKAEIPTHQAAVESAQAIVNSLRNEREMAQGKVDIRSQQDIDTEMQGIQGQRTSIASQLQTANSNQQLNYLNRQDQILAEQFAALSRERQLVMKTVQPRDVTEIDRDIKRAETKLANARKGLSERQAKLQQVSDFEAEERDIENRRKEAKEDKAQKDIEVRRLTAEVAKKQKAYEDAKALRESQEQDLVTGFSTIIETAAREQMIDEIEKAKSALDQALGEQKTQAASADEKEMYDALRETWLGTERRRKRGIPGFRAETRYRPINKAQVNADFIYLMNNGPDDLMKTILYKRMNPATKANYTSTEVDDLMKNESFVKKMQPEMVKHLIGRKALTGGLTSEDVDIILQAPWGGNAIIDRGLAEKSDLRATVEGVMGQGALERHDFKEKFGQLARKHPSWILLLFGIPLAAVGALTMGVAEEAVNQQR